jgi:hypothetical protein
MIVGVIALVPQIAQDREDPVEHAAVH